MTNPTLDLSWNGWTCNRPPMASEPNPTGYFSYGDRFLDQTTGIFYFQKTYSPTLGQDGDTYTNDDLTWAPIYVLGAQTNTSRSYTAVSSPAFNSPRTPSTTNDTSVVLTCSLTSTLLTPASVTIQVDGTTIGTLSFSGVAAANTQSTSFIVPIGSAYKFVQTSGVSSIVSLYELTQ
jgi:hypothetical protein